MIYNLEILQACRRAFSWKQISTILILAVGLTLTTVMFAVGYGYSAFSIPFKDAGKLVTVGYPSTIIGQVQYDSSGNPRIAGMPASLFFDLKERKDVFTDLAAYRTRQQTTQDGLGWHTYWQIMAPKQNTRFPGLLVTDNYFDVFGVSFHGLHEWKKHSETTYPVPLIVSHEIGTKNFGYDAMGKEFDTDSGKITLFGILPEEFILLNALGRGGNSGFSPLILNRADTDTVGVVARLAPGVTSKLAEQMLSGISHPSTPAPDDPMASRIITVSVQEQISKSSQRIVLGAWLLGGLVLIMCIANVAGIYLMRCSYQIGEFALKSALGANFLNLVRPLYFELIILTGIAAVIAGMMIQSILTVLANMVPVTNMAFGKPVSGLPVFVFLLVCMIVMVVVSLTPAVMVVIKNYRQEFKLIHLTTFRSHKVTRMLLIISQSAIAMLLLAISGMAVRGYLELFNKDTGVDSSVLVTEAEYSYNLPDAKILTAVNETFEALRAGNRDARAAVLIGTLFNNSPPFLVRHRIGLSGDSVSANRIFISPGFVRTVRGKLIAGREFNENDRSGEVVLINAALASRAGWSPHESIGQVIQGPPGPAWSGQSAIVIGVVNDFLSNSWEDDNVAPAVFMPIPLIDFNARSVKYIVHPDALRQAGVNIEQTIYKFAPETAITRHATWDKLLNSSAAATMLATFIVVIFTIAAIIIILTGIFNTILFAIVRRTREIAIHLAMGATYVKVFWIVISDVVKAGLMGLLLGVLVSWWIGEASAHFFYNGIRHHGLLELITVIALMLLIIVIASLIPALRILRIEINRALAAE